MDHMITGPFCTDGNFTGRLFLQFLEVITPWFASAIENDAFDYDPNFQEDGAPSHFYVPVREYLYGREQVFLTNQTKNLRREYERIVTRQST